MGGVIIVDQSGDGATRAEQTELKVMIILYQSGSVRSEGKWRKSSISERS